MSRPPPPSRYRIGLFGGFGVGNYGNDASLEAMLRTLRRSMPDAELVCICPLPERVATTFGVTGVPISAPEFRSRFLRNLNQLLVRLPRKLAAWTHALRTMRSLDVVVIPGTGVLDDLWHGPGGFPYVLFRWCLAARMSRTPMHMVSIGAGPIKHPVSRWLMTAAARMASHRSYRDRASAEFMASLGLRSDGDRIFPDLAFGLPVPPAGARRTPNPQRLSIAVGVMAYAGWRRNQPGGEQIYRTYIGVMVRFLRWLLAQQHEVRLITGEASDQRALDDILRVLGDADGQSLAERIAVEPASNLHDIMRHIADADLVVATRYHNVVGSLRLGKPVLSIGYAPKNDALMAEMGLAAFCQHIEHLDEPRLREQFTLLAVQRHEHAATVAARVAHYQERLREQERVLIDRMLGSSPVGYSITQLGNAGSSP